MSGGGLRNWRGEIIQPKAPADDVRDKVQELLAASAADFHSDNSKVSSSLSGSGKTEPSSSPSTERRPTETIRKDEFGRDVVEEKRRKKSKTEREEGKKREKKHKHKRHKHRRDKNSDRSRSPSLQGRLNGTPPPEDPFRPQLDEERGRRSQWHTRRRSRSRSRCSSSRPSRHSRSRGEEASPNSRGHRRHYHRSSSQSRSRSRNRSRSPPSSRSRRRRSVERAWTHNAFEDRSPSPPREVNPLYRPEPETWVSRAGGVYLPRK